VNRTVVLDTNIIISAGIRAESPPAALVQLVLKRELIMATCPSITNEYLEVIRRSKFQRFGFPPVWVHTLLRTAHHIAHDPEPWPSKGVDPDDVIFLALAKHMGATLITGNLKHYPTSLREDVHVISPQEYLSKLGSH
jgi:putative PIN family toxin of toxin-antitoxin system